MLEIANYGPVIERMLWSESLAMRIMPLAPAAPDEGEGLTLLRQSAINDLFGDQPPESPEFAECVRSALYLYFSALDESHRISQDIPSGTGSLLHGVMHRQEPDYSNAKYWFRRVGEHELFPTLRAEALGANFHDKALHAEIESRPRWDPFWFVDQCERAARGGPRTRDLEKIQQLEWQLVFDYSYRRAVSG